MVSIACASRARSGERVALFGGDPHAGPGDAGGFVVRASLSPVDR